MPNDLKDIREVFRNCGVGNRPYGFSFYGQGLKAGTHITGGEIRGIYGHTLKDTAAGWVISAVGGGTTTVITAASTAISTLSSGKVYALKASANPIDIEFDGAPGDGTYIAFVIADNTNLVRFDVDGGTATDRSLWGRDLNYPAGTSKGKVILLYAVSDGTAVKWACAEAEEQIDLPGAAIATPGEDVSNLYDGVMYPIDASGGPVVLNLDDAGTNGKRVRFFIRDDTNAITIVANTFAYWGATDIPFPAAESKGKYIELVSNGTKWAMNDSPNIVTPGDVEVLADGKYFKAGAARDVTLGHDGTDSILGTVTGDLALKMRDNAGAGAVSFRDSDGAEVAYVDSDGNVSAEGDIAADADGKKVSAGEDGDVYMRHDGTNSAMRNKTGTLTVDQEASADTVAGRNTTLAGGAGGAATGAGGAAAQGGQGSVVGGVGGAAVGADAAAVGGLGYTSGGAGGAASAGAVGATGGSGETVGGDGGAGSAGQIAGAGGTGFLLGGNAGADGGGGGNNGGDAVIRGGAGTGAGVSGNVIIGDAATASVQVQADSVPLKVGAGGDLSIQHDGANSTVTSGTGKLSIVSTPVDKDVAVKLGDAADACSFRVEDSAGAAVLDVGSNGLITPDAAADGAAGQLLDMRGGAGGPATAAVPGGAGGAWAISGATGGAASAAQAAGGGGQLTIIAGAAGSNALGGGGANGANLTLRPGAGTGAGTHGDAVIKLQEAAGATKFQVTDSADVEQFSVNSDGTIVSAGFRLARQLSQNVIAPQGVNWVPQANGAAFLPLNMAAQTARINLTGLKVGDVLQAYRVLGGIGAGGADHTTVDARLHSVAAAAGGVTDTALGAGMAQVDVVADTVLDNGEDALAVTVADDTQYFILVTVTTANAVTNDLSLIGAKVTVDMKL